ncbi:MAG: serine/threonine protein kinase [Deltaproteobacteria bacterium]|nr:serine/threonine protein kinase [Deltaproteobacteria bacterium]
MMHARAWMGIGALCAAGLAAGCGPSFAAVTPPGFVELEQGDYSPYDYRATTADGLVLAVREIEHDPKGEIGFWTRAIENRMRQRGGYALIETRDVKSADGLAGKQLRFGHDEGQKPHLYYVTVFVTDATIYLLEAGGTKELMEKGTKEVDAAASGFRAK